MSSYCGQFQIAKELSDTLQIDEHRIRRCVSMDQFTPASMAKNTKCQITALETILGQKEDFIDGQDRQTTGKMNEDVLQEYSVDHIVVHVGNMPTEATPRTRTTICLETTRSSRQAHTQRLLFPLLAPIAEE